MCLILLAHDAHPEHRLVVAANRDEFYARPTAPAAAWADAPFLVAGRDLEGGGTWMGVTRRGRWAAVTNFRDAVEFRPGAPSRGHLVGDFLRGEATPEEYLRELAPRAELYNGFNLLLSDGASLRWFSNRDPAATVDDPPGRALGPGVYGVSNALLDTPWPKVERGKRELARALADGPTPDALLHILLDRALADEATLPDTGVGAERERALSAAFIATPAYGTRSSTALLVDRAGRAVLVERTFAPGGEWSEVRHEVRIDG